MLIGDSPFPMLLAVFHIYGKANTQIKNMQVVYGRTSEDSSI